MCASQNVLSMATSPSGKARVCKTLIMGSNPIVASKEKNRQDLFFLFLDSLMFGGVKTLSDTDYTENTDFRNLSA